MIHNAAELEDSNSNCADKLKKNTQVSPGGLDGGSSGNIRSVDGDFPGEGGGEDMSDTMCQLVRQSSSRMIWLKTYSKSYFQQ